MTTVSPQDEGYRRGLQGLAWEDPADARPSFESPEACFLFDVRHGSVARRGRVKKHSQDCLKAFHRGLLETFPEAAGKPFASAIARLWVRWLAALVAIPSDQEASNFSFQTGGRVGALLSSEFEEGSAGGLLPALLDKRIHLTGVRDFLKMSGWLRGTIAFFARQNDPERRAWAHLLESNFSSIVLRALHNNIPGYAAKVVWRLSSMTRGLDQAIRGLAATEPEAARHLRNNRSTIIARALHSGLLDYAGQVAEDLPGALKDLNQQIQRLESSSPETAQTLKSNQRSVVYRALTNGRLDYLRDAGPLLKLIRPKPG